MCPCQDPRNDRRPGRLGARLLALLLAMILTATSIPAQALTVGEEKELGEKLLSVVRRQFRVMDEPDISQYINRLGRQILNVAGPQYFNYHFFVIDNKEFNAFAAPGGLIFLHTGLIDATANENELVSVMAHEVGHAASRHYAERLEKAQKLNVGSTALALIGMAMGAGPLGQALIAGSAATSATLNLRFSRQAEEEADRLAYKWMLAMGRDPHAMVTMLQKMRQISRYRRGHLPAYLLTHPEPENRLIYIEDRLLMDNPPRPAKPLDPFPFLRIKYRLLTLTKDPHSLLPGLRKKADTAQGTAAVMAHYGLSQAYLAERNYAKAASELKLVIDHFPDQPILLADLGVIYAEAGDRHKALAVVNQAAARTTDDAYVIFQQARLLQQSGQLDQALARYRRLLGISPDYSRLHYRLGQIMAAKGNQAASHYQLGIYYWYQGDDDAARQHLRAALQGPTANQEISRKARKMLKKIKRLEKL